MKPLISRISLITLTALLSACSQAYGGGTYGTGLPDGTRPRESSYAGAAQQAEHAEGLAIRIEGSLVNASGDPISGRVIIIRTADYKASSTPAVRAKTDGSGQFVATLGVRPGGALEFRVEGAGPESKVRWILGTGQRQSVRLMLGRDGTVHVVQ